MVKFGVGFCVIFFGMMWVRKWRTAGEEFCILVVAFILVMLFLFVSERMDVCRNEAMAQVIYPNDRPSVENVGRLIYLQSDQPLFTPPASDESFNLVAPPDSIIVVRKVEYCQYQAKEKGPQWRSKPSPYDTFFGPSNPLHLSPYPTLKSFASNFTVGEYSVDDETMHGLYAKLKDWIPDERSLLAFQSSEASSFFHYLDNGYFYHNYSKATGEERLSRHISNCVAGDIRAHFQILESGRGVSLIAMQKNERGGLGLFRTLFENETAFIQAGQISMEELFEDGWGYKMERWIYRLPFLVVVGWSLCSFTPAFTPRQIFVSYCLYCTLIICCMRLASAFCICFALSVTTFMFYLLYKEMRRQQTLKGSLSGIHLEKRKEA